MYQNPWRAINWQNVIFMSVTHLVALIGIPIYIYFNGVSLSVIALAIVYSILSGLGITVGYHRLFAHRTFSAGKFVTFLGLFFGAATFEMSALEWASQHRDHHRYVDTDKDPYSIKKGFFYAHMGWLLFWKHHFHLSNVEDLKRNPLIVHQHKYYLLWCITSGILTPMFIGFLLGHPLEAFLWAVCGRITFVYQGTFCINSVCHMFGKATYDIFATAKDHWAVALVTWGEGFHNFHHRFPNDYRNGIKWFHYDPGKWAILILNLFKLTTNLKQTSHFSILNAKLAAENLELNAHYSAQVLENTSAIFRSHECNRLFLNLDDSPALSQFFKMKHEDLNVLLLEWENKFKQYKMLKQQNIAKSNEAIKLAWLNVKKAQAQFSYSYKEWKILARFSLNPSVLSQLF